ncbi:UvrD-like helicase, ATP-binding domain, P-loop containing nucleoside triphosphate hydrolase [Tanacetum coccineum]
MEPSPSLDTLSDDLHSISSNSTTTTPTNSTSSSATTTTTKHTHTPSTQTLTLQDIHFLKKLGSVDIGSVYQAILTKPQFVSTLHFQYDYISRSTEKCLERFRYLKDSEVESKASVNPDNAITYVDNSKVSESLLLMWFYLLPCGVVSHLLCGKDGDLPMQVNDEQMDIILSRKSSFIIGRSGTGITNILTMKLFQYEHEFRIASDSIFEAESSQFRDAEVCVMPKIVNRVPVRATILQWYQSQRFKTWEKPIKSQRLQDCKKFDSTLIRKIKGHQGLLVQQMEQRNTKIEEGRQGDRCAGGIAVGTAGLRNPWLLQDGVLKFEGMQRIFKNLKNDLRAFILYTQMIISVGALKIRNLDVPRTWLASQEIIRFRYLKDSKVESEASVNPDNAITYVDNSKVSESLLRMWFYLLPCGVLLSGKDVDLPMQQKAADLEMVKSSAEVNFDNTDVIPSEFDDIADTFINIPVKNYPLIITFQKFLLMLDGTLESSFFERFRKASEDCHGNYISSCVAMQTFIRSREVTFGKFCSLYWPHFNTNLTKKFDSSKVFTEIISHIKGGLLVGECSDGKVSCEGYCLLAESRSSTLTKEKIEILYNLFQPYEKMKSERGEFDLGDFINDIHRRLKNGNYKEPEISLISGELPVLFEPCNNENAIVAIFGGKKSGDDIVGFGAEQVILVRDDPMKTKVCEFVGKNALVLATVEYKGLEFHDSESLGNIVFNLQFSTSIHPQTDGMSRDDHSNFGRIR